MQMLIGPLYISIFVEADVSRYYMYSTFKGLGSPSKVFPFISSIARAASDVLANLIYVTPEITHKKNLIFLHGNNFRGE